MKLAIFFPNVRIYFLQCVAGSAGHIGHQGCPESHDHLLQRNTGRSTVVRDQTENSLYDNRVYIAVLPFQSKNPDLQLMFCGEETKDEVSTKVDLPWWFGFGVWSESEKFVTGS